MKPIDPHPDDPGLAERRLIEAGLADVFDEPAGAGSGPGPDDPGVVELHPGERVAEYQVRERLGEGGFAVVYLADQLEPVRRQVALKIVKLGMDTRQVIARFDAERQALAMMDHPNVAKVLGAGTTATGRPYFVMEYVPGIPITDYCDRHRLTVSERLELFIPVCQAIQHAHQKGIIHRDVKPSNVLVSVHDGRAVPKAIDFGIAKATSQRLTEHTLHTEQGQLVGTPEYVSPEQAEMTGLNVDTRTDIYSLGVLLYELLAGRLPFDPEALRHAGYAEIQRIIRDVDPPRASVRLAEQPEAARRELAARRRVGPSSLVHALRGDLDWITMKALEKDRTRRYDTASELAADVRRYLERLPILARPPSAVYRMRKLLVRYRAAAAVIAAFFLLITATSVLFFAMYRSQVRENERTASVVAVLEDLLRSADPENPGRVTVTMRDLLVEADRKIRSGLVDEPDVEAGLRATIGRAYMNLRLLGEAEPHLVRALALRERVHGRRHAVVAASLKDLGDLRYFQGDYTSAEPLYRHALDMRLALFGEEHVDVTTSKKDWADLLFQLGDYDAAAPFYCEVLESRRRLCGEGTLPVANSLKDQGELLFSQGEYREAMPFYREALEIRSRLLDARHPLVADSLKDWADVLKATGAYEEAEQSYLQALAIFRQVLGEDDVRTESTVAAMNDLDAVWRTPEHEMDGIRIGEDEKAEN